MADRTGCVRIAAVGDIHVTRKSRGLFQPIFSQINNQADVLLLCGDLTDYGLPEEAHILAQELAVVNIPVVAVLGNHDFESEKQEELHDILLGAGVMMLDGDSCEIGGIGFAGCKGFAGGFANACLEPWGEPIILQSFVREAMNEALKLEAALARLDTPQKVVVLHYSPIHETVEGELSEIIPYLGSRRLEEPLNRFPVPKPSSTAMRTSGVLKERPARESPYITSRCLFYVGNYPASFRSVSSKFPFTRPCCPPLAGMIACHLRFSKRSEDR